jgi:alkylation response protein AidB-like acyl-CoA dehydrogenase
MSAAAINSGELGLLRDAARDFVEAAAKRSVSLGELWQDIVRQGWLDAVLASDAPVRTLSMLSSELGRAALALPLAETVASTVVARIFNREHLPGPLRKHTAQGLPAAVAIIGEGSLLRRESLTLYPTAADGILCNVEHVSIARALLIVDKVERRAAWCLLPHDRIRAVTNPGYADAPWHDLHLNRADVLVLEVGDSLESVSQVTRLTAVARAWGAAERSVQELADYVKIRQQFGQPIGRFQSMQHRLANLQIILNASEVLIRRAADALDIGDEESAAHVDAACCYSGHALRHLSLECQHGFGAVGYMEEHSMPRRFRRIHADLARHANPDRAAADLASRLLDRADGAQFIARRTVLTPEAETLRVQLSAWLDEHWTVAQHREHFSRPDIMRNFDRNFLAAIGERGFIGLTIPVRDGGLGRGAFEQFAFDEEINFREAPSYSFATAQLLAPSLARFGTEAQRARYLPLMLAGKAVFCLGYSEPNAGSDLASLKTRAELRGDEWVVNGAKIWTTLGTVGDYVWLAARTDPAQARHAGISVFIVPMDAPGITIRPLAAMNGERPCAVFYDDVRLPADALVGDLNQGWSVITHALSQERLLMGAFASRLALYLSRLVAELQNIAQRDPLYLDRVGLRCRLGQIAAEVQACRLLALQAATVAAEGGKPIVEAAISKVFSGELEERMAEAAINWLGPDATLNRWAPGTVLDGLIEHSLLMGIMYVVGGGSNDIQRNIIAHAGLGLPR